MKIYVASSWRNERYPAVVCSLRAAGHEVYDFREPVPDDKGFHWSEIDPDWKGWSPAKYRECLEHPTAQLGFSRDMNALRNCEACVLVMPCGRSAHLEAGWACGAGKRLLILLADGEPELMNLMADGLCLNVDEVIAKLNEFTARGHNV
jgi:hypothetical protein